jgi:hypothetical protein
MTRFLSFFRKHFCLFNEHIHVRASVVFMPVQGDESNHIHQGMDEEHQKLLELEKSLLEQHAPEQLSAMFRLERGAAEGGRASRAARIYSSAAENSTATGATAERDSTSQLIHSELLRQHRDTPMSKNITLAREKQACERARARTHTRTHTHTQPKSARNARCIC